MQLREVAVTNFRAFETATVRLPGQGLVLVAGANNAGKSALLSALDVIVGVGSDTQTLRRVGSDLPATVVAVFDLTDDERSALFAASPRSAEFVAGGAGKQLHFVFTEQPARNRPLGLGQVFGEWPGRGPQPFVTTGPIQDQQGSYSVHVIRGLLGGEDNIDPMLLQSRPPFYQSPIMLGDLIDSVPEIRSIQEMLGTWRQRYYHFRALRQGGQRSTNLVVAEKLNPTGDNLTAVLLDMLTNRPSRFAELRRLIAEIVPLIGQLNVRTRDSTMQTVFTAGDIELNVKDLGTGVEQLLMALVVGLTEVAPFTLVIEEPETNLHHAAQRALLGLLKNWSTDRQIIAATHSPVLLDWSPGGDRLWHVVKDGPISSVAPVRDNPSNLLTSLGVRLSDVLSATRILVLEGPSDEDILEVWFPEILRNPNVAVLHGEGGDNAKHADRFADWLSKIDKIGLRRVLYLRDRDELSSSMLKKLEDSETVGVLKRRELENYLLDAKAISEVLENVLSHDHSLPTEDEVANAMQEAAEDLRGKVVINRVCRQIGPEQPLVDHRIRQQLANERVNREAITASLLERLMSEDELRGQIDTALEAAESDVARYSGRELLAIAPGEEILKQIFMRFANRGYNKRADGILIAKAIKARSAVPSEIRDLLHTFTTGEPATQHSTESSN